MASDSEPLPESLQQKIAKVVCRATEKAFEAFQKPPASPPQTPEHNAKDLCLKSAAVPKKDFDPSSTIAGADSAQNNHPVVIAGSCIETTSGFMSGVEIAAKEAVKLDSEGLSQHCDVDDFSRFLCSLTDEDFDFGPWQVPEIFR
jgi:hypothetical protein